MKQHLLEYSLDEVAEMVSPDEYFRAGRPFLVHLRSVAEIHDYFNGKLKLILRPEAGKEVIVSRENAGKFKLWMGK